MPDALRGQLACDGKARIVLRDGGTAISVGRSQRIVPERTRLAVEQRDGGCRVPGCDRRRWLQAHHIEHWEDGRRTDTLNLVALCSAHHRLHHRGLLGIAGDADDPDGLVFTDARGRRLTGCGRPAPPGELTLTATYAGPTGERIDPRWTEFRPPPGTPLPPACPRSEEEADRPGPGQPVAAWRQSPSGEGGQSPRPARP